MTYQQTIDYLFTRLPLFSRVGATAYKADLDNTIALCAYINNPHTKFRSVHIAGTNGKGSVSHMLAAIFQKAGYKTGLYTSPHLNDFRERIKINGDMVDQQFVVDFVKTITPMIDKLEPSFFEITVAMAFAYFASEQVDIAIIETGLGGRLDSTNIITPDVSIITNIGWDHMNLLGITLEQIAAEKAGIIKPGVPVVIGEIIAETLPVFEKISFEKKAPLSIASKKRQAVQWHWDKHDLVVEVAEENKTDHNIFRLDLAGIYQTKNLITVVEACRVLKQKGWNISNESMFSGLQQAKKLTGLHGRWEIIEQHPITVLDVAHNVDGITQILEHIEMIDHHQLHFIIGMVNDKEIDNVLKLLPPNATYYFTQSHIPRALPVEQLMQKAAVFDLGGKPFPDVNTALKIARSNASKNDMIIICGSVFLVAEVER